MTEQPSPAELVAASPAAAAPAYKCMSVTEDGRSCRSWCGDARCDAAAGVPTGWKLVPIEPTTAMLKAGYEYTADMPDVWNAMLAASPVAPVGAPTEEMGAFETWAAHEERLNLSKRQSNGHSIYADARTLAAWDAWQARAALLSAGSQAEGCELATDATKQQREHSVHLAATPIDQDFRMRPASSEAAPSAEGSGNG